jgi:tRNA-modifying protein YgfZ
MSDYDAQVAALDAGALVRAMPSLATLEVRGADRLSWLGGLVTNDLSKLRPGEASYALSVDKTGRLQADLWVLVDDERLLLAVEGSLASRLAEMLDHYLIMEDAEIAVAQGFSWWLAHGPESSAVVEAARAASAVAGRASLGRCPTAVIAAPLEASVNLAEVLTAPAGCLLATPEAWDRIRVERSLPVFGVDYEPGVYPQEASLEDLAVSFQKGCYLGQEAVFMLEKRGRPPRRLVTIAIEGDEPLPAESLVEREDGTRVGRVTTSLRLDGEVRALATVKHKHSDVGSELRVAGRRAQVVPPVAGFR